MENLPHGWFKGIRHMLEHPRSANLSAAAFVIALLIMMFVRPIWIAVAVTVVAYPALEYLSCRCISIDDRVHGRDQPVIYQYSPTMILWIALLGIAGCLVGVLIENASDDIANHAAIGIGTLAGILIGGSLDFGTPAKRPLTKAEADANNAKVDADAAVMMERLQELRSVMNDASRQYYQSAEIVCLSADELLRRTQALQERHAQWETIAVELNPGGDAEIQQLIAAIRGPHLFAPHLALGVIADACQRVIALSPAADAVTALREAVNSADPFVR